MNNQINNYYTYSKKYSNIFKKKMCLFFDHTTCNEEIIRSHTIQKRRSLERIAIDGHVYGFSQTKKIDLSSSPLSLQKISINDASTFYGFCKKHDNELFDVIDNFDYVPSIQQAFLLTYRTLIRELYTKNAATSTESIMNEIVNNFPNFVGRSNFEKILKAHQIGMKMGLLHSYYVVDEMFKKLVRKDFNSLQYFVVELKTFPEIMVSGSFMPEYDYFKCKIQDLIENKELGWLALNVFADSSKGIISFTWQENPIIEKFLISLIKSNDMINKIVELAFTNIENVFFSLEWWNNLSITRKSRIEKMVHDCDHYDSKTGMYIGIRNNNLHFVDWDVIKTHSNNSNIMKLLDT
ncbi:MAG TPA: hypothetical protein VLZ83_11850 [Edaphocola sp.]|nr:hypothetical protein [Edaphocola sp.]